MDVHVFQRISIIQQHLSMYKVKKKQNKTKLRTVEWVDCLSFLRHVWRNFQRLLNHCKSALKSVIQSFLKKFSKESQKWACLLLYDSKRIIRRRKLKLLLEESKMLVLLCPQWRHLLVSASSTASPIPKYITLSRPKWQRRISRILVRAEKEKTF